MASFDHRSKNTRWLGLVLIFLVSKASSENTTENATRILLSSMAPSSESENTSFSNVEFTSLLLPPVFSTMEIVDLDTSKGMSATMMVSPSTAQIVANETNTHQGPSTELAITTEDTKTPVSPEMSRPFFQPSASPVRYSNSKPLQSTLMNLESSFTMQPVSSDTVVGAVSSMAMTPRITPQISTGDHLTKATVEPLNASVVTNSAFQTAGVLSIVDMDTATNAFKDLTISFMTAKASEYSELATSEAIGDLSSQPINLISFTLHDSSTADVTSKAMEMSSETTLSPSMTLHVSSAVQHSSLVRGSGSLLTKVPERTIDAIGHTTLAALIQPSRTAEPQMSATVTSNETANTDKFTEELSRLQKDIDDLEDEINGWRIAVAILAACLALILLVVIIRLIIKWRQRDQPAKMTGGGVDDLTRNEVLEMRKNENKSFFKRPGPSSILDKGLNRISSIFNKRSSSSHEFETFGGAHPSVMDEVDETEIGRKTDVEMTQYRHKGDGGNGEPKMNGDGQEVRHSFTEVDLH